jgi:hypothetical protein
MIDGIVHARRRRWKDRHAALRRLRADGLLARALLREQLWNDCNGHFRGRLVDACISGATSDAIVHVAPQPRIRGRLKTY